MEHERGENPRLITNRKTEKKIGEIIQNEFLKMRQNQEKKKISSKITDDLLLIAKYINANGYKPVPILKSLGILFFGRTAAFNLAVLTSLIICCRAKTMKLLSDEGWDLAKSDQDTNLASIVGFNNVKNWAVYNVPQKTSLSNYLEENQELIATEKSFGLDKAPPELLIGPGLPPQNVLTEPHFPLVSIQYELTIETVTIADAKPSPNFCQNATKKMEISNCFYSFFDARQNNHENA